MSEPLHKDFKEFLQLLIERNVRFMIIGGYAVAWHGRPRNTDDLDVWVSSDQANAELVTSCLRDFGFNTPNLDPSLFTRGHGIVRLGVAPWKIEIFVAIPGVDFDECYAHRVHWPVSGMNVPMISLPDLRKNKIASGRPKDFSDLAHHLPNPESQP